MGIEAARPARMRARGWLEFADLSLHTVAEDREPREPFIRGELVGGLFFPRGDVVGPLGRPGGRRVLIPGWLDLRTRTFYSTSSGATPFPPYVQGVRDEQSLGFFPTQEAVHAEQPGS